MIIFFRSSSVEFNIIKFLTAGDNHSELRHIRDTRSSCIFRFNGYSGIRCHSVSYNTSGFGICAEFICISKYNFLNLTRILTSLKPCSVKFVVLRHNKFIAADCSVKNPAVNKFIFHLPRRTTRILCHSGPYR